MDMEVIGAVRMGTAGPGPEPQQGENQVWLDEVSQQEAGV